MKYLFFFAITICLIFSSPVFASELFSGDFSIATGNPHISIDDAYDLIMTNSLSEYDDASDMWTINVCIDNEWQMFSLAYPALTANSGDYDLIPTYTASLSDFCTAWWYEGVGWSIPDCIAGGNDFEVMAGTTYNTAVAPYTTQANTCLNSSSNYIISATFADWVDEAYVYYSYTESSPSSSFAVLATASVLEGLLPVIPAIPWVLTFSVLFGLVFVIAIFIYVYKRFKYETTRSSWQKQADQYFNSHDRFD